MNLPIALVRRRSRQMNLVLSDKPDPNNSPVALYAKGFSDETPPPTEARLHKTRGVNLGFTVASVYFSGVSLESNRAGDNVPVHFKREDETTYDLIVSVWSRKSNPALEKPQYTGRLIMTPEGGLKARKIIEPKAVVLKKPEHSGMAQLPKPRRIKPRRATN